MYMCMCVLTLCGYACVCLHTHLCILLSLHVLSERQCVLGVFEEGGHWDVTVEYVKTDHLGLACHIEVFNCGRHEAVLHLIPQFWFRSVATSNTRKSKFEKNKSDTLPSGRLISILIHMSSIWIYVMSCVRLSSRCSSLLHAKNFDVEHYAQIFNQIISYLLYL